MKLYQLMVQSDEAWQLANALGKFGLAQVIDLYDNSGQSAFGKRHWKQIKRIEETLHSLEYRLSVNSI